MRRVHEPPGEHVLFRIVDETAPNCGKADCIRIHFTCPFCKGEGSLEENHDSHYFSIMCEKDGREFLVRQDKVAAIKRRQH